MVNNVAKYDGNQELDVDMEVPNSFEFKEPSDESKLQSWSDVFEDAAVRSIVEETKADQWSMLNERYVNKEH